jgi:apolipoprotein N-acyltransferase
MQVLTLSVLAQLWWRSAGIKQAALLGWVFATAHGVTATWWLYISLHDHGGLSAMLAALAVLTLQAGLGLYLGAALGLASWSCPQRQGWLKPASAFVGAWLCAELARAQWFTGFPWGASGYAHVDSALAVLAPLVGVYGIGAAAAALAMGLSLVWGVQRPMMRGGAWVMALAVLLALNQAWRATDETHAVATVPLTLLQGNVPQDQKFGAQRETAINWYVTQIHSTQAGLVLAPETAIATSTTTWTPGLWLDLTPVGPARALMLGAPWQAADRVANSVLAWAGQRTESTEHTTPDFRYDKRHLVPFGEFIPSGFAWFVKALNIPMGEFDRGHVQQPNWSWGGLNWAPNICYEDLFGEELAQAVMQDHPAQVLVNFSNIAWFGDTVAQLQHLNISRMRTLELQRPMVRVTNTGSTAVIDHEGHVTARLPVWTRDVLRSQVTGRDGPPTLYARWTSAWGLWPLWLSGLMLLCWPILGRWRRRA